jgi:hypothetical protein
MATEQLYANATISGSCINPTNAHGIVDSTFTGNVDNSSWTHRWGFDNPVGDSVVDTTNAILRLTVRKFDGTGTPTIDSVQLFDSTGSIVTDSTGWNVTSLTTEEITITGLSLASLTDTTGDTLEVEIVTSAVGGSPPSRAAVQVDEIRLTVATLTIYTLTHTTDAQVGFSERFTHTTDASVGFYHETDALVVEFPEPTNTISHSTDAFYGQGHQTIVDDNDIVWMVGVDSATEPDIIKLWEGPAGYAGPGDWKLHTFTHGSGSSMGLKGVALAKVLGKIHVAYVHFDYGGTNNIRGYHIVYNPDTDDWTDNGAMGLVDGQHNTWSPYGDKCSVDLLAVADDELVARTSIHTYVTNGIGENGAAWRAISRNIRSVNQDLGGINGDLSDTFWGNVINGVIFSAAHMTSIGNDNVYLHGGRYSRLSIYDKTTGEGDRRPGRPGDGISRPLLTIGDTSVSNADGFDSHWETHNNRTYAPTAVVNQSDNLVTLGIMSAEAGSDPIRFDEHIPIKRNISTSFWTVSLLIDNDHIGLSYYTHTTDKSHVFLWNGIEYYETEHSHGSTTDTPDGVYTANKLINGWVSAWGSATSPWTNFCFRIPTWQRAHTTDAVIDGPLVYHKTDALVVRGGQYGEGSMGSASRVFESSGKFYTALRSTDNIYIFESTKRDFAGSLLTTLNLSAFTNFDIRDIMFGFDWVEVSGILHFVIQTYHHTSSLDAWRYVHHHEYNISTDTWTNNGEIYNDQTEENREYGNPVGLIKRTNGDLIAVHHDPYIQGTDFWYYQIDTGTGFGTHQTLASASENTIAAIFEDNNDVHFILHEGGASSYHHWRLDSTDTLSARQTITPTANALTNAFPQGVVDNNVMYWGGENWANSNYTPYVYDAATGSDAPTWTLTQISTTKIAGGFFRFFWFTAGLNGRPTAIYVGRSSTPAWEIYKTHFDGTSWIEKATGYSLPIEADDLNSSGQPEARSLYHHSVDSNNIWYGWWLRDRETNTNPLSDYADIPILVNLNPTEFHRTDAVITVTEELTHTTDVVTSVGTQPTITHTTDAVIILRSEPNHSTDARLVLTVDHSTDAVLAYDLATTIIMTGDLTNTALDIRQIPIEAKGQVERGEHAPQIYRPTHKILKK